METQENMERKDFKELSTKELRKIYFRSESIKSLATIIAVAIVGLVVQAVIINKFGGKDIVINSLKNPQKIALIILNILTFVVLMGRFQWGHIIGIVNFMIWIIYPIFLSRFSISLLLGIYGLYVLIPSGNLFGPNGISAKDLKREFKWRKNGKVA